MGKILADETAVSETIGYILIFTIVLTCIGIILLYGSGVLDNAKDQNNFKSMEHGLSLVQSDMKQVAMDSAPVKTTKIHMNGGTIFANSTTGGLTIAYPSGTNKYDNTTGSLSFVASGVYNSLSIENGGLWEQYTDDSAGTIVSTPRIYGVDDTNTIVINVMRIYPKNSLSIGGTGTLNVVTKFNKTLVYDYPSADGTGKSLTLTYNTKYPTAWKSFFENQSIDQVPFNPTASVSGNSVTLTLSNVKEVIIIDHMLDMNFTWSGT
jgi:hypothetical protein